MTFINISVKGLDGKHICVLMVIKLKSSVIMESIANFLTIGIRTGVLDCLD